MQMCKNANGTKYFITSYIQEKNIVRLARPSLALALRLACKKNCSIPCRQRCSISNKNEEITSWATSMSQPSLSSRRVDKKFGSIG